MKLNELKIMVTGGASGMGAHFARRLHEAGARVAVGDVNEAMMSELPPGIARRKLDVSREDEVASFVEMGLDLQSFVNMSATAVTKSATTPMVVSRPALWRNSSM